MGAANDPGRWNSRGVAVVYASTTIALACLETLVHLSGDQGLPLERWLVAIDVPSEQWQQRINLNPDDLQGWDSTPPEAASTRWGDRWIGLQQSLLALVPSVAVPEERNALINPAHHGCRDLQANVIRRWTYDSQLVES